MDWKEIAKNVFSTGWDPFDVCRELVRYRYAIEKEIPNSRPLIDELIAIDSEMEGVPVGEVGGEWNATVAAQKLADNSEYIEWAAGRIVQICSTLIESATGR